MSTSSLPAALPTAGTLDAAGMPGIADSGLRGFGRVRGFFRKEGNEHASAVVEATLDEVRNAMKTIH